MISMIPEYNTMTFNDVFENKDSFIDTLDQYGETISDDDLKLTFLLLSARYGNSPIANRSVNQFTLKVWSTVYQYGPTWVKEKEIQEALRNISLDELRDGTKAIFNHAYNPSTAPSTDTTTELEYINDQNTTKYKKSKVEAYATLLELLKSDVCEAYINKFKNLFKQFVMPEDTLLFITEEGDE